jgi:uncharacterized membrane protein
MGTMRLLRHLLTPDWALRRAFPPAAMRSVEAAIAASESLHQGELRFAVEAGLDLPLLWRDVTPRQRAIDLFAQLRVWDTAHNSGVLLYVQWVDHAVEIVADRGIDAVVEPAAWSGICRRLEQAYRRGDFEAGTLDAIAEIGRLLSRHFPAATVNPNELPDRPLIL